MTSNLRKALRDLLVMMLATGLLFFAENVGDFGIPVAVAPMVSAGAMLIYRYVRDLAGKGPAA